MRGLFEECNEFPKTFPIVDLDGRELVFQVIIYIEAFAFISVLKYDPAVAEESIFVIVGCVITAIKVS